MCGNRKTLAVVSGALLAGGALAYARSSQGQRRRRSEGDDATTALARNGDRMGQNGVDGRLAGTKRRKGGLRSLHFLAAILLKKIGPNGTRYLLGLTLTAVISAILCCCCCTHFSMYILFFIEKKKIMISSYQ